LKQIEANQIQLKFWADHAPMNYQHKFDLVAAEVARVWGQTEAAADRFDRAIQAAKHHGYLQEEALANELAAKFYLAREKTTIAKAYLQEARYSYLKWGATAKVQDLEQQYAQLLKSQTERSGTLEITLSQSASSKLEVLDLASVLKASQAIASEIVLDQLLTHLMTILIENAGAQKGYLILPTEGEWRVEAIGSIHTEQVAVLQALTLSSIEASPDPILPIPMIYYVIRTQESVVLNHAVQEGGFETDPWIIKQQSKSILCAPLLNRGRLSGVVFLENSLTISAFTPERIEVLRLLSTQAAISIDNARLLKQQAELNQALRTEIAEREKAERDRDRLITILEASTDHIGMADPEGKTLWINAQVRKLMGISLQDNIAELKISDYHPAWAFEIIHQQGIPTAIAHGSWMGETALLERNGNEIPVSQLLIAHKTPEGQLEYLSTIMRDISALKSAEAQVRQLNTELEERVVQRTEQLEAANKELEAFSYSVSHDLRAPLRAIDGFSRMIQEDYSEQLDSEANRYLKIVRENAKRMGELIDDLLTLSRLNRKELYKQPIFPNDLIEGVLQDLTLDMEGRQIEFTIAELPICQADLSLLKQVWVNILSNAIKYTQYKPIAQIEVGYVIIQHENIQHENIQHENIQHEDIQHENIQHEDMKHGIANEGAYFIRDNGAGFDMQYADNLFGVFQRLHREQDFKGTGVGLATVQRIIHRHGGRIWAEAAIDQGATFYFTLPDEAV
jgi:PAS domain S-box-containing protein